jgi:hypothetical protein
VHGLGLWERGAFGYEKERKVFEKIYRIMASVGSFLRGTVRETEEPYSFSFHQRTQDSMDCEIEKLIADLQSDFQRNHDVASSEEPLENSLIVPLCIDRRTYDALFALFKAAEQRGSRSITFLSSDSTEKIVLFFQEWEDI